MSGEAAPIPALEDIPTECHRCHKIFDDSEMGWMQVSPTEKWWVCDHCAECIAWANRCINLLRQVKHERMIE